MSKGNGKTLEVQEQILAELRALNQRVDKLDDKIGTLGEDLTMRLDKLIENTGAHWRDLDRRVSALEAKQGK